MPCKGIPPLQFSDGETNSNAMLDQDPLVDPDVTDKTRYCLGTRLQMHKNGKGSHKTLECSYHNLDLSKDGKLLEGGFKMLNPEIQFSKRKYVPIKLKMRCRI